MDKIALIKQPCGIGDILFCQKIVKEVQKNTEYKKIIFPVIGHYAYINEYLGDNNTHYVNENESFAFKEFYDNNIINLVQTEKLYFIPLCSTELVLKHCNCHQSNRAHGHMKYNFMKMNYSDWKHFVFIKRNQEREKKLIDKLGININEPYNLINQHTSTYPTYNTRSDITIHNPFPNIYMDFYEGFNIFDWMGVFEHAQEIHTVEGGVWYLLEVMNLKNVTIYSKFINQYDDFCYMKDLCDRNWRFIN
jgi:hypothetical protein